MMKKCFVPYDIAKELNDLGFCESSIAYYDDVETLHIHGDKRINSGPIKRVNAPLYDQVIDWFIENHNIVISADLYDKEWTYVIQSFPDGDGANYSFYGDTSSRKEALNAGILKTIELVKRKV